MTDKKEQTKSGATELSEDELGEVQGGWSWGATNTLKQGKKADSFNIGMPPSATKK